MNKIITLTFILLFSLATLAIGQTRIGQTPEQVKSEVNLPLVNETEQTLVYEMKGNPFELSTYYFTTEGVVGMILIESKELDMEQLTKIVKSFDAIFEVDGVFEGDVIVYRKPDFNVYITLTQTIIIAKEYDHVL